MKPYEITLIKKLLLIYVGGPEVYTHTHTHTQTHIKQNKDFSYRQMVTPTQIN